MGPRSATDQVLFFNVGREAGRAARLRDPPLDGRGICCGDFMLRCWTEACQTGATPAAIAVAPISGPPYGS